MDVRIESRNGLARAEGLLLARSRVSADLAAEAIGRARLRANGLLTPDPQTEPFGLAIVAGSAMSALWLDAGWEIDEARELADELAEATNAPRALIGLQALGNPDLLALPLMALVSVQMEALLTF